MKVTVVLNKHKTLTNGEHPLLVRVTRGTKNSYKSMNYSLPITAWNFKRHELKTSFEDYEEVNHLIKDKLNEYSNVVKKLKQEKKEVTPASLIKLIENPLKDATVFSFFNDLINQFKAEKRLGNAEVYQGTLNKIKAHTGGKDILFGEIDYTFLNRFSSEMKKEGLKGGTISIRLRTFRAVYKKAIKEGYALKQNDPFDTFKISDFKSKPNKRALTPKELESFKELNKDSEAYRYFMFSYYTAGMNFTDMAYLKWSNIDDERIRYLRKKTSGEMSIGRTDNINNILNYYRGSTMNKNDYVFPILNRHVHKTAVQIKNRIHKILIQVNSKLREYAEECNIDHHLTTYVARHTAITTMIRSGNPLDVVQGVAGHQDIKTTMGYLKEAEVKQRDNAVNSL